MTAQPLPETDTEITVDDLPGYPTIVNADEQRRAFVLECLTSCGDAPGIDGKALVQNLSLIEAWLKDGKVPEQSERSRRTSLKPV